MAQDHANLSRDIPATTLQVCQRMVDQMKYKELQLLLKAFGHNCVGKKVTLVARVNECILVGVVLT